MTTIGASRVSPEITYETSPSAFIRHCKNPESLCNPCMEMAISMLPPTMLWKYVITMGRITNLKRRMGRSSAKPRQPLSSVTRPISRKIEASSDKAPPGAVLTSGGEA
jgi:hypothetical protein